MSKSRSTEELYFTKDQQLVRLAVRDYVKKKLNPNMDDWEEAGISPLKEILGEMGELGFLGIRYDPEWGGQDLDGWYDIAFLEEISHIPGGGLPMAIAVHTHMATPALHEYGSDYLKNTYLKPAIDGKMVSAIAVTEPDAGSDVAALKSLAVKKGDHYVLSGSKIYITNGTQADFVVVLARTSEDPGYHSFSLLVVPTDLPGFVVSRKLDKMGMKSSDTAELFFDNIKVPVENLIGNEGEGFIYQMRQFQHERFAAIPMCYGMCEEVIDMTLEYVKQRIVFGKPLIAKQVVRHRLSDWITETEMLKQFTYHIVRMKEKGMDVTREVSMGKLMAGRLSKKVTDGCLQFYGGMGFMNEALISRFFRDARLASIGGGADEVMQEIISKQEGF
jgi:citronellyl-CoA dehydrogenase